MNKIIKNITILYLEDNAITREYTTKSLQLISNNVVSVATVQEALNLYEKNDIDIIISDIDIAGQSGIGFIKNIRANNKCIPIILLTAHSNKEFLFEAIKLNLIEYLVKPINFELLYNVIKLSVEQLISNGALEIEFISGIKYNLKHKLLFNKEKTEKLTASELKLLKLFLDNKNSIVSSDEILYTIWEDTFASEGTLKSLINKLRNKIGKESIKNYSKLGYQLVLK